jgi:branched-chain amino acid transport system ATP-binding protein
LSPKLVKDLRAVIMDVKKTFASAVLLVEQNAGLALTVAERGYLLHNGRIVASGPISELRDDRLMRDLYLGNTPQGH